MRSEVSVLKVTGEVYKGITIMMGPPVLYPVVGTCDLVGSIESSTGLASVLSQNVRV